MGPSFRTVFFAAVVVFGLASLRGGVWAPALADDDLSGEALWALTQDKLFNGQIHNITIRMNQAVWNQLHDDEKNHGCVKTDDVKWVHARDFVVDGIAMKNVALRVRGNSSRCIPRVQLSVDFNKRSNVYTREGSEPWHEVVYDDATKAAIKDRTLFGLEEISLRRSFNDSTSVNDSGNGMLARESVSTWAAAQAQKVAPTTKRGAPVYRTVYALVDFEFCANDADTACDNRFRRLYLISEAFTEDFFKMRYDDNKPTYFSMSHGCALRGDEGLSQRCLEPESVEGNKFDDDDAEERQTAADIISGADGLKGRIDAATTPEQLGKVLDLDSVMNYAVVATTVGHWDSAYGNFNNDVLYFYKPSGKWKVLIWDLDNTFDYDGPGGPFRTISYAEVAKAPRILFDKIFAMPALRKRFNERLNAYLNVLYETDSTGPLHDRIIEARDRYIAKSNEMLVAGERQNLQRAKEMLDYARDRERSLRNQLNTQ